nr:AMP-binding protein [Myxococcus sp. AM009]
MVGPALPPPRHLTVNAALADTGRSSPLGLTFVDASEREVFMPWADVYRRAKRTAAGLARLGVREGDRVALLLPTSPAFMDAFFGTLLAGAVPVPLYPPVRLGRLEEYHRATSRMLQVTGSVMVLTDSRVRLLLGPSVERARPRLGCHTVDDVSRGDDALEAPVRPEALGLIQFSSGSTVDPKPVMLTHEALLAREGRVAEGARALVSVGRPVAGFEVEVRGETGEVLAERCVGQVFARGPSLMAGYFADAQATDRTLTRDGWLDTGDLGFIAEGELFLTGRAKDVVIIRGANHAPQAFEEPLQNVAGVRMGCAVALGFTPEGAEDEALLILAERAGQEADDVVEERIRAAVVETTGVRPHAVRLLVPGTLPRTSSGKLRRAEALRRYLAEELAPPKKVGAVGLAVEMAKSALAMVRAESDT